MPATVLFFVMQELCHRWAYMQNRVPNSQRYLVVGLVGLGLPLTVTIRVSRVSAMVSARFSVH